MKQVKKLASVLLALVMLLSLTVTVFAEDSYSITINNTAEGHTYEAYQIFVGDLSGDTLSNIRWGSGVSEAGQAALGDAAAKAETLENASDAEAFAKAVAQYLTTPAASTSTLTDGKYVLTGLTAGYYLVKDRDGSLAGSDDAYTEYIVKVVKNTEATPKSDVPHVEKKVKDANDTEGTVTDWQDSADHDIGDMVSFRLSATLANNVSSYDTYKVVFHDTLSAGLTYQNNATVYIDGVAKEGFSVNATVNADGTTTLTVSCDDVKALGATDSSVITVEYTAQLNANAVIGAAGNPNEVYLEYSNNPNHSGTGDNETGNTPEDTVIVFTYKTVINKVTKNPDYDPEDETSEEYISLEGAAFKLEKLIKGTDGAEDTWETVGEYTVNADDPATTFTFTGLDDGTYRLTETATPAGYNSIDPITFAVTAEHSEGDAPALTDLNGNKISGEITFTAETTEGSLSADIVNNAGSTLPETGGIGTTIFYVLGGILVLAAVILLVTKKRMSSTEE